MIRHIFKIIWNERRPNAWLLLEYIIVFCVLWFCCDYGFSLFRNYHGETGIDIGHTYVIDMDKRLDMEDVDKYQALLTLKERIQRYPGVETVAFGDWSVPYGGSYATEGQVINSDSARGKTVYDSRQMNVTPEYFKVFRIELQQGQIPQNLDEAIAKGQVVIAPFDKKGQRFGNYTQMYEPITSIETLLPSWGNESFLWDVAGISQPIKIIRYGNEPLSIVFYPLKPENADPARNDIMIRIRPEAEQNFAENFTRDMREQLTVGPYFLLSVTPIESLKKESDASTFREMTGIYIIMGFVIVNIFLGLLGSFWFRVQARRSEIGLRVALGSSKRKVRRMIVSETLLLLAVACVVGTVACLNLSKTELIQAIGLPVANHEAWGIGAEQNVINFVLTSAFLAIVSVFAVWYPARQASEVPPADVLREE